MESDVNMPKVKDAKKLFRTYGACSSTMFFILNREFGNNMDTEIRATETLAGGIMRQGYQCGMLWGASLAVGAEAYKKFEDNDLAIINTINTTQNLMESFSKRTNCIDCYDVTKCDWTNKLSAAKYMLTGKFLSCFELIDKWAPEAIYTAKEGLSSSAAKTSSQPVNCASEVAKKMGASDELAVAAAGLAGGMGLSGNACGALGTAIWLKTVNWIKNNPKKQSYSNPDAKKILEAFEKETKHEYLCSEICGKNFGSIDEHSEYIRNGGCAKLIDILAKS